MAVVAFGVFDVFLITVMKMAMYGFYEQRIEDALVRRAELAPADSSRASEELPAAASSDS